MQPYYCPGPKLTARPATCEHPPGTTPMGTAEFPERQAPCPVCAKADQAAVQSLSAAEEAAAKEAADDSALRITALLIAIRDRSASDKDCAELAAFIA